ncbi:glycosyltransferase [Pseudorhodoferax sp.]|uniref:glycosyltransferase n=1 Tax=Pseudorhodoferax sp. TaxID=1993553 RepID=UPI002DD65757|nr:nucleotide disphospho-sugar-binding domain-containing protein [Pseudorhodoferax sp.]
MDDRGSPAEPAWIAERRRPRVLLAWEHGRNFGRLSRLLAVARMVEQQGGEPVWAVPGSQRNAPALRALSHRRLCSPVLEQQTFGPHFRADSFADVLLGAGFNDARRVEAAVRAWTDIIRAQAPECVVLDYAPAAQLTCQLLGVPAFQLTNGFDAPPPECPPYASVRAESPLGRRTAERAAALSDTIARVGRQLGSPRATSLAHILRHPCRVFECIPEADPYGPRQEGLCIGPLEAQCDTIHAPWPEGWQRRRVFAHLRTGAGATELLDELQQSDAVTLCVWRDAPDEVLARYRQSSVRVLREPLHLGNVLAQADAVINQGSTALVSRALLAGKPQLILPADFEKLKVAQRVVGSGAAAVWNQAECSAHEAVRRLLHAPALGEAARAVAARYTPGWFQANRNRFARELIGRVEV